MAQSHRNVEDVIIEDAEDVELSGVEDVFIEPQAVDGRAEIADAEDVRVVDDHSDYRSVYRDEVIDADEDVVIEDAEDVRVTAGSVDGDLTIEGDGRSGAAGDVWIADPDDLEVERVQDVYIKEDAVDGDVAADNPEDIVLGDDEAVHGEIKTDETAADAAVEIEDVEDVKVMAHGVDGDVVVADPDDISAGDTGDPLSGGSTVSSVEPSLSPSVDFDRTVSGSGVSADVGDVETGLQVTGDSSSIGASLAADEVVLHIAGNHNTVNLFGVDETVKVFYEGESNTLKTAPGVEIEMVENTGVGLSQQTDERFELDTAHSGVDPEEIIEKTREEALEDVGLFGTATVNYQEPAPDDKERCEYCYRESDTIIQRVSVTVVRVFGLTWEYKEVARSDECQYCTLHVDYDDLDDEDRLDI